ncbi:ABC transporter substrate-binding protein [Chenggangzhangella methanolivorans]|uniref:ABC transporter substrate-binding protein n=1 Tax=Chenggangzhangella methanolivorans TaxID=1437009 RepID=UPI0021BD9C9A|nr:ABC transporter substrate-binding protein [Chenggangzhangella methanolivorans]
MLSRRRFGQLSAGLVGSAALAMPAIVRAQGSTDTVKMGWFNTTTVSAQIAHVLKRTDIAARNGLKMEMIQLNASPAVNEAIVSNAADVGTLSDFAAVTTMAVGAPVTTIASQARFRSAVLATKKSGITDLAGLKGKVFGTFGITAFQNAQEAVIGAGLKPGSDMTFVNVGPAELADAVGAQRIDAFFTYDPFVSFFENSGHAQVVSQNLTPVIVLTANNRFVKDRPEVVERYLRASSEALFFASQNHDLVNGWFRSLEPAKNIPEPAAEGLELRPGLEREGRHRHQGGALRRADRQDGNARQMGRRGQAPAAHARRLEVHQHRDRGQGRHGARGRELRSEVGEGHRLISAPPLADHVSAVGGALRPAWRRAPRRPSLPLAGRVRVGVVQERALTFCVERRRPRRSLLNHPHPRPLPARGGERRALLGAAFRRESAPIPNLWRR